MVEQLAPEGGTQLKGVQSRRRLAVQHKLSISGFRDSPPKSPSPPFLHLSHHVVNPCKYFEELALRGMFEVYRTVDFPPKHVPVGRLRRHMTLWAVWSVVPGLSCL